jgi:hypothetical protein
MANTAHAPEIHAQWLYFFPVANLDTEPRGNALG